MPSKPKAKRETTPGEERRILGGNLAGLEKDFYQTARYSKLQALSDLILTTQTPKNAQFRYPWGLYEEMLDLDPHLRSVVHVRKVGVTSLPVVIQPGDDSPRARMLASWVEWWLDEIGRSDYYVEGGFFQDRLNLLDGIPFGLSVQEIIWEDREGWLLPARILQRPLRQFRFDWSNELRLVTGPGEYQDGEPVPPMKFLVFIPYTRNENPYGNPWLRSVYFPSLFKRSGYRFWAVYLDKFGSPTIQAKYPKGATPEEMDKVFDVITAYQQETGILIPEDFAIELIEAKRGGSADYNGFIEACNREVSKGVLGQNLTTEVKGGSYAAANVHENIRQEILESDARLEMQAWDRLIRWAVELNFAPPHPWPHFRIRTEAAGELRTRLESFRQMADLGYPLSRQQIAEELHLLPPIDEADEFIAEPRSAAAGGLWGNPGTGAPGQQPRKEDGG